MTAAPSLAGFADPVDDAQRSFRALLDALARPGSRRRPVAPQEHPTMLPPAMAALALTLADAATPVWLAPSLAGAAEYLRFHCGCPLSADPRGAAIALAGAAEAPPLVDLGASDERYPETDTTLVLAVDSVTDGPVLYLEGPGIQGRGQLRCRGLPAGFVSAWQAMHARYPLGSDVFLVAGGEVVGLPRSLRISEEEACTSP
ncbi:phosphonate C-P lyase system protein PhnH [Sediminicurvatus halobius]|uniref:Phosphonate C-P lyase system protein PhnH n=1 Tax=Sediminicurvatus halobius TaxID=2182432 RepID=A0A2U2MWG3_9GAMM|nr:phosphonate C-P lyase system protein PhnH [Spiribacter halobius]PWG61208.1 phosphonate C-P lyase system protein PhnH [Spiribacter halobius]UEX77946.1 phosphonate C-P lyase system protein PhnH [Spiribacter halobius]